MEKTFSCDLDSVWLKKYKLVVEYYSIYHNLFIVKGTRYKSVDIGRFIESCRSDYNNGVLSDTKFKLLDSLGVMWNHELENYDIPFNWIIMYHLAKDYYDKYGNLIVKHDDSNKNHSRLRGWLIQQRKNNNANLLNERQVELLNGLGMVWNLEEARWNSFYLEACEFYKNNGHLEVSQLSDDYNVSLFNWVKLQKKKKKLGTLDIDKINKLNELNINWDLKVKLEYTSDNYTQKVKLKNYKLLVDYYNNNGHINVPINYVASDGTRLGVWLYSKKIAFNNNELSIDDINYLNSLGMIWNLKEKKWQDLYSKLVNYKNTYGDLLIPKDYVCGDGTKLGIVLSNLRAKYKNNLSDDKIRLLDDLGMVWNINLYEWYKIYDMAKEFYLTNNHLNIPGDYVVDDIRLGAWISTQRSAKKCHGNHKLNNDQIVKLDEIGMIWDMQEYKWNVMYNAAVKFYILNRHLNVGANYVTDDGLNLGTWIHQQRSSYNNCSKVVLNDWQIGLLNEIGMIWNVREEKNRVMSLSSEELNDELIAKERKYKLFLDKCNNKKLERVL